MQKKSPWLISFLQSTGLFLYISLVATIFWKGNQWFGPVDNYFGPVFVLSLLVVSALICATISLGYPIYLALGKKKVRKAVKIVILTAIWMVLYLFLTFGVILLKK